MAFGSRKKRDTLFRFKLGIFCLVLFFFLTSLAFFIGKYGFGPSAPEASNSGTTRFSQDFYLTFYLFFGCGAFATCLFLFSRNAISGLILVFLAGSSMILVDYLLTDCLTTRIWMYAAFIAVLAARFRWPWNQAVSLSFAVFFSLIQRLPAFLGENLLNASAETIGAQEQVSFAIMLCSVSVFVSCLKMLRLSLDKANRQIEYLHRTITKVSEFNQSLQSYARTADEIATKKERLRISREIHDISGYIFTNIIALMDAIISTGCLNPEKTGEICLTTRIQAQEGLQETRRALRALRTLDDEREKGLRAIYKIKGIFEETTGVEVKIESGNMPLSFGEEIDLVIYRTVQEALTNALRHGHATRVWIDFRIQDETLFMSVLDNGTGAKKITKGIGLAGMEERISQLKGEVEAMNAADGGFRLTVRIPLPERITA